MSSADPLALLRGMSSAEIRAWRRKMQDARVRAASDAIDRTPPRMSCGCWRDTVMDKGHRVGCLDGTTPVPR